MPSNMCRPPHTSGLCALLLALSLFVNACDAKETSSSKPQAFPEALLGTWHVSEVRPDRGDTHQRVYKANPHKYLGRVFEFTRERLTTNANWGFRYRDRCEAPQIIVHRTTALKAVSQNLCSRLLEPVQPTPADFGLPLANDAKVEVLSPLCADGLYAKRMGGCHYDKPPPDEIQGAWLIALAPDQLALRWHEEVFLILKRLPKDAKPAASFDCAKAATPTEKAICGSVALAAYDVSVAETYKYALDFYQFALKTYDARIHKQTLDQLAAFKRSQKEWLAKRDACGAEVVCLDQSMGERIWATEQEIINYAYEYRQGILGANTK